MNKSALWAVIVVLITIIIWMTRCNNNGTIISKIDTVSDTSYIHDTLTVKGKTKIKPVPVPYYIHDTIIDSTGNIVIIDIKKYIHNINPLFLIFMNIFLFILIHLLNLLTNISLKNITMINLYILIMR